MIGWWIVIATQSPEERHTAADRKASIVAMWEVGMGGLDWIDRLIAQGDTTKLRGNGYPDVYMATVQAVLPLLAEGPPSYQGVTIIGDDYVQPPRWFDKVEMHLGRATGMAAEHPLWIEAWDLS